MPRIKDSIAEELRAVLDEALEAKASVQADRTTFLRLWNTSRKDLVEPLLEVARDEVQAKGLAAQIDHNHGHLVRLSVNDAFLEFKPSKEKENILVTTSLRSSPKALTLKELNETEAVLDELKDFLFKVARY
ncbi:MAG: hypothetical protein ACJ75H_21680 [Thermoanaerobaculia bacterium]